MLFLSRAASRNRERILTLRDEATDAVDALARLFEDEHISDDGTIPGRLRAILGATEHRFVPGLQMGVRIGLTGFRKEFEDPWAASTDQVGHFLTAVRLAFAPEFLSNPILPMLLGGLGDTEIPLRLILGHEKAPDPPDVYKPSQRSLITAIRAFRVQYQATTDEDLANFQSGRLEEIPVGTGLGNSRADLRLSYKGWQFGHWVAEGRFPTRGDLARWIRQELGKG